MYFCVLLFVKNVMVDFENLQHKRVQFPENIQKKTTIYLFQFILALFFVVSKVFLKEETYLNRNKIQGGGLLSDSVVNLSVQ